MDFSLLSPLSYPPPISSRYWPWHISVTPAPHLLSQCGAPSTWTLPTPTTHQLPPLLSAPCATCLLLMLFLHPLSSFVASLGLNPGLCQPLGVLPSRFPPRLCAPAPPLSVYSAASWHLLVIVFFGAQFAQG